MTNEGKKLAEDVHAMIQKAWADGHAQGEKVGKLAALRAGFTDVVTGLALLVGVALGVVGTLLLQGPLG